MEAAPDPKSRFLDLSFWEPLLLCIVEGAQASFLSEIFFLGALSLFFVMRNPYVWKLLPTPNQGIFVFPFGSVFFSVLWSGHGGSLNDAWIFTAQDHLYALQEHASQVKILVSPSLTTEVRPFNWFLCRPAQSKCFKSLAHSLELSTGDW